MFPARLPSKLAGPVAEGVGEHRALGETLEKTVGAIVAGTMIPVLPPDRPGHDRDDAPRSSCATMLGAQPPATHPAREYLADRRRDPLR